MAVTALATTVGKVRQYVLVRDARGIPVIDNADTLRDALGILDLMTEEEKQELRNDSYS
jgi:hypothetical protein